MHSAAEPFITNHRLARLNAWMRLWLVWFAGACAAWWSGGERAGARQLDARAYRVCQLIVINAAARFTPKRRSPTATAGSNTSARALSLAPPSAARRAARMARAVSSPFSPSCATWTAASLLCSAVSAAA
jgi:hypothetical protein